MVGMKVPKATGSRTRSRDLEVALTDAAEKVLVRDGAAAVTVRAVAAEAGVAPMGVYNHFGSKEGLVDALLQRGFDGLRDAVAAHGEHDPIERLRASGVRYRSFALSHHQHYAAMFGGAFTVGEPSPELQTCAGAAFAELVSHVSTVKAAGLLIDGDPEDIAQQVWSTVHGAVSLELQHLVRTPDPEQTYLALLDLVIRGIMRSAANGDGDGARNGFQPDAPGRVP
jgi:AcrR family transcriptional regulator